jgi:hypothetical protein
MSESDVEFDDEWEEVPFPATAAEHASAWAPPGAAAAVGGGDITITLGACVLATLLCGVGVCV